MQSFFLSSVDAFEFKDVIEEAVERNDDDRLEALLCGAVKYLKINRAKPEPAMFLSLMHFAKTRPSLFFSEVVIEVRQPWRIYTSFCLAFLTIFVLNRMGLIHETQMVSIEQFFLFLVNRCFKIVLLLKMGLDI